MHHLMHVISIASIERLYSTDWDILCLEFRLDYIFPCARRYTYIIRIMDHVRAGRIRDRKI